MSRVGPSRLNKTNRTFEIHAWGHHQNNESSMVLWDLGTLQGSSNVGGGAQLHGILAIRLSQEDENQHRRDEIRNIGKHTK